MALDLIHLLIDIVKLFLNLTLLLFQQVDFLRLNLFLIVEHLQFRSFIDWDLVLKYVIVNIALPDR